MKIELPADLEPFCDDYEQMRSAGAYALTLRKPDDPAAAWNRHYDHRPPWWQAFLDASETLYVGATGDVLGRLEDHRDGDVRRASLLRICDIKGLHTVWFAEDFDAATVIEYNLAAMLRRERPEAFVHSR